MFIFLNVFLSTLEGLAQSTFLYFTLNTKIKYKYFAPITIFLTVCPNMIMQYVFHMPVLSDIIDCNSNLPLRTIYSFIIFAILVFCLSYDKFLKKLFVYVLLWVCILASDVSAGLLFMGITKKSIEEVTDGYASLVCNIIYLSLLVILFLVVASLVNKRQKEMSFKDVLIVLSSFLLQFGMILSVVYVREREYNGGFIVFLASMLLLSIILDVSYLVHIKNVGDIIHKKDLMESAIEIKKAENDYYMSVIEQNTSMAQLRHDYTDQLQVLSILINKKDAESQNKALDLISNISGEIKRTSPTDYCEHSEVNALLNSKLNSDKWSNAEINIHTSIKKDIPINTLELCRLFSNLINNACEAAEKCEKPFIDITTQQKDNCLIIDIKNNVSNKSSEAKNDIHKKRFTTKENKKSHGYGNSIIEEIVEKYDGYYNLSYNNNVANSVVMLQLKKIN